MNTAPSLPAQIQERATSWTVAAAYLKSDSEHKNKTHGNKKGPQKKKSTSPSVYCFLEFDFYDGGVYPAQILVPRQRITRKKRKTIKKARPDLVWS